MRNAMTVIRIGTAVVNAVIAWPCRFPCWVAGGARPGGSDVDKAAVVREGVVKTGQRDPIKDNADGFAVLLTGIGKARKVEKIGLFRKSAEVLGCLSGFGSARFWETRLRLEFSLLGCCFLRVLVKRLSVL